MTDTPLSFQTKDKPRICAIDLDREIIEALQSQGLHCFCGTLGSQVKVPNSSRQDAHQCLLNYSFPPNLHEYDIILIDLKSQEPIEYNKSEHTHSFSKGSQQTVLLSSYPETIFDPRPLSSTILRANTLRVNTIKINTKEILVIVFCSTEDVVEYHPTIIDRHGYHQDNSIQHSLYEFIPFLDKIHNKAGENVVASDTKGELKVLLQKYSKNFTYEAVFEHPSTWIENEKQWVKRESFIPLLLNSDNEVVGFVDFPLDSLTVFAFPQLPKDNKKDLLLELIDEILPGLFPKIFPYSEQFSWLKSEKYFPPNQANLLQSKKKLEDEYKKSLTEIEGKIERNQIKYQFLHDLITETGDSLVKSIEHFLVWLGFKNIVNMDETNPEIKEEDLQVPLENGLLVIEAKGIGGTSKDSECSQISKIKYRRAKERGTFDVFALYIVNHQRYLPPADRKNPPFSKHQIDDARSEERGLLTTYELFSLYSNIEKGFVTKEDARASLLEFGLVQFKPSNSYLLGCPIEVHHKGKIAILNIENIVLKKGALIIAHHDEDWFQSKILEIRLNDETVESVSEGEIGIKLSHSVFKTSELWLVEAS
jgi:hypothetical protein